MADQVGRGRILIIGLVGYVISLLLLLVPQFASLSGIYAMRALTGFFVAAVVPVVSALVAEYTPEDRRARRYIADEYSDGDTRIGDLAASSLLGHGRIHVCHRIADLLLGRHCF